ncbi:MAG: hypothetical protein HKP58_19800 [Desulfatitalea sp.]|nr:hypothetical protein [Desulfatitalea sp.]NNK02662.1 hypothetical protein [Desulfatitalea sp.]
MNDKIHATNMSTRVQDAIDLKVPDRVPIFFDPSYFPAKYEGITCRDYMYDTEAFCTATRKFYVDYEPDMCLNPSHFLHTPGTAGELIGLNQILYPGQGGVSVNHSYQYVENEYMTADEYDEFLDDITGFTLTKYLPRVYKTFKPLGNVPPLKLFLTGAVGASMSALFATPDFVKMAESFYKAGQIVLAHNLRMVRFHEQIGELGVRTISGAMALAPYDFIGDLLRGMKGISMDMYKCPDKLLAAIDKVLAFLLPSAIQQAKMTGIPEVFIPLHKGADAFMTPKHFETFYWPSLKKLLMGLIDAGLTPFPFFEGDCTSRLEYFTELPKGKVLGWFDQTDPVKAKAVLGNTMCMTGFMPVSMLQLGTADEVKTKAKQLIDVLGKDGGYIMGPNSSTDEAKPELMKTWYDFTREYGKY